MANNKMFNLSNNMFNLSDSFTNAVMYHRFVGVSVLNDTQAEKLQAKHDAEDASALYTDNQLKGMEDSITQFKAAADGAREEAAELEAAEKAFVDSCCTPTAEGVQNKPEIVRLYLRIFAAGQDSKLKAWAFSAIEQGIAAEAYNALSAATLKVTKEGKPTSTANDFETVKAVIGKIFVKELSLPVAVEGFCAKTTFRINNTDARAFVLTFVKGVKAELDKEGNLTGDLKYSTAITCKKSKGEVKYNASAFCKTLQEVLLAKVAAKTVNK